MSWTRRIVPVAATVLLSSGCMKASHDAERDTTSNEVRQVAVPVIESVTPSSGAVTGGTMITFRGRNIAPEAEVWLGDTPCDQVDIANARRGTCVTRSHFDAVVSITVRNTNTGRSGTLENAFTFGTPPTPTPGGLTATPTSTSTAVPSSTPTSTFTAVPTSTPTPTSTSTSTPTSTPTRTPTSTRTPTRTLTPTTTPTLMPALPTATPTQALPPGSAPSAAPADSVLRLNGREYLASMIQTVFNVSAGGTVNKKAISIIREQLAAIGGGPCDAYNVDAQRNSDGDYPNPDCKPNRYGGDDQTGSTRGNLGLLSNLAAPATGRFAVMLRACQAAVAPDSSAPGGQDATVMYAVKLLYPSATATSVAAPTDTDLVNVFGFFYPNETPSGGTSSALVSALRAVSNGAIASTGKNVDGWRFVLLTVCESPGWHVY